MKFNLVTGKSLSEALLFAEHRENMLCTKIVLNVGNNFSPGIFMYWTCNLMNNLSSYCGLVDAKIRAYDKDLPVPSFNKQHIKNFWGKVVFFHQCSDQ